MADTVVFVPTYNERENVESLLARIEALGLGADVVFLDDNSPDGTGEVLDGLAKTRPHLSVIHRARKTGIGSAHLEGIRWAYDRGYKTLVTMDCDFTHPPEYIPEFVKASAGADVVVGSRYLKEGSLADWNMFRKVLTATGHFLTTTLLEMPYDATGAFRLYRLDRVPRHVFELVQSRSYSFFFESLYLLHVNGLPIREIPIDLPARTYGHSKMALRDAVRSVGHLVYIYLTVQLNPERLKAAEPLVPETEFDAGEDTEGWDDYWLKSRSTSGMLFDLAAAFYRRFIIKPALNSFVRDCFRPGAELLHAGCGSGQVDSDVTATMKVTALDISLPALDIYKRVNGDRAAVRHGSIFKLPFQDASFDGVYNLGVMEHFSDAELDQAFAEFRRVLRKDGRVLLFWPPEFGLSVLFLRFVHWVFNSVLKKPLKLHPDEISRIRSRSHAKAVLERSGFALERFYFGPRDLFTQAVIVASPRP